MEQARILGIPASPITARRWRNFKANRRGFVSLWLFLLLFFASLFSEMIANERPIFISLEGRHYWPIFKTYVETDFPGGFFETEPKYKEADFAEGIVAAGGGTMIWPPIRYSFDTAYDGPVPDGVTGGFPYPPSHENWLGTDDSGRDVTARLIYGWRISVLFGLILTIFSSILGVMAGASQGYFGGWVDLMGQRFLEIWGNLPVLYLLIIMASFIVPGFWSLLGLMLLFSWTALVGVVRAEFLRARNFDYVRAARALGVRNPVIMFRHMLPNAMVATLTLMPFITTGAVTTLTSLDFLGLGMPPGSPSLGELLSQGKNNLHAPWLGMTAFFSLAVMLCLLTFIGEAARDAFDPRKTIGRGA
jgi:microcin C transport system permease protein